MTARTRTLESLPIPLTAVALAALCLAGAARADVKPYPLCGEGMILQQGMEARLWGTADAGETVTVTFRGKKAAATAGTNGSWRVAIPAGAAGGPFELTLVGKNTITYTNVLVGEVWLCSGQSNMDWGLNSCDASDKAYANTAPANPRLRLFTTAPVEHNDPSRWYRELIVPLLDCRLRGVIWYQGEGNGGDWNYRLMLPALIGDWRTGFQNPDLAFHIVQLPADSGWEWCRESQTLTAMGGGYGASSAGEAPLMAPANGGSGGGAGCGTPKGMGVAGPPRQGYDGGAAGDSDAAGGGGAGGPGESATSGGSVVRQGGAGRVLALRDGVTAVTYASGGWARRRPGYEPLVADGRSKEANTGDGGDGGSCGLCGKKHIPAKGGNGGFGIVIVRYVTGGGGSK